LLVRKILLDFSSVDSGRLVAYWPLARRNDEEVERCLMILAIDIGNTNSCFALLKGDECLGQWRLSTNRLRTADEFVLWLENFFARQKVKATEIEQSIVACVVPSCRFPILKAVEELVGKEALLVTAELMETVGVQVKTDSPKEVGADRVINAFSAFTRYSQATIVLDFGTATTFDVADEQGNYIGGVIAPGINLSLEALHRAAARLPSVEIKRPAKVIGTGTESAMQAGIYFGYLGMIERIVKEIKNELGVSAKVIATGGLAPLFAKNSDAIDELDADLTMRGLYQVARKFSG